MLRVLRRKCFHCSNTHDNFIKIHNFFSTKAPKRVEVEFGGKEKLELSSGQLARLADGTAVARIGNTAVMTTVVSKGKPSSQDFLPLTVDYRQKAAAAGRIPTNFLRRELGASDREILVGRMVDRSLRPLFKKGYNTETGINCNLLSVDGIHNPEIAAICAASAALTLSDVPWGPALGAVQLGYVDNKIVINPTRKELARSQLNLVLAGTSSGLTTMLEGDAKCLDHRTFLEAIKIGLEQCAKIASSIEALGEEMGKPKRQFEPGNQVKSGVNLDDLKYLVDTLCSAKLKVIYTDYTLDKQGRDKQMFSVRDEMISQIRTLHPDYDSSLLNELFFNLSKNIVRNLIFEENLRVDGRSSSDIRPISCEVNLHNPLHGSALFQRGQTQVLCTVALDSLQSSLKLDPITAITGGLKEKNFMLHYEFPGYANGELGKGGARRDLGHGALAERALRQVLPNDSQFVVRLTSEVLESNGSSSMASICGGTMALLDAGIPMTEMVSGVAMGLVTDSATNQVDPWGAGSYRVLTDIMGMEDFLGDMDFKFAASRSGVCALQADVKLPGISLKVVEEAIEGGLEANHRILDIMSGCINTPRDHKDCWPVSTKLEVPPHKRAKFVGQAGLNLKRLTNDTGVQVYAESEGVWQLFAPNPDAMAEAEVVIEELLTEEKIPELEFGAIYTGRITEILDQGIMLQLHDQLAPVLLHNSHLSAKKIRHPSVLGLKVGEDLQVKYYGRDPASGNMRLSRKALTVSSAAAVKNLQKAMKRKDDDGFPPPPGSTTGEGPPPGATTGEGSPPGSTTGEESQNQQFSDATNPVEPSASSQQPRRLVINENKDRHFIDQNLYKKIMENSNQRAASIDTSKLFVRKQDDTLKKDEDALLNDNIDAVDTTFDIERVDQTEIDTRNDALSRTMYVKDNLKRNNGDIKAKNDNIQAFYVSDLKKDSDSYSDKKQDTISVLKSFKTELNFDNPEHLKVSSENKEQTKEEKAAKHLAAKQRADEKKAANEEAVYYEIDKLFNQLMALNLEIKAATERKENVDKEWNFVKENIPSVENSPGASKEILQAFNSDKVRICKKFSAQSKAINETLILLTRQYRDIKINLEKAKKIYMKAKNPVLSREEINKMADASEADDINNTDNSFDTTENTQDTSHSQILDSKQLNNQVISQLVQETVQQAQHGKPVLPSARVSHTDDHEQALDDNWNYYQIPVSWNNALPVLDSGKDDATINKFTEDELAAEVREEVTVKDNVVTDLDAYRARKNFSQSLWKDMERLKSSLTSIPVEKSSPVTNIHLEGRNIGVRRVAPSGDGSWTEKLMSMRWEIELLQRSEKRNMKKLKKMVENSLEDFQTLSNWYNEAINNNDKKSKEYLEAALSTHKNLFKNIQELETNKKFLRNQRSGVEFVGRHLYNKRHPLVELARKHISKLASIYDQNLRVLSGDKPLNSRVSVSPANLWEEYHRVRVQLKQIRKRLWEVELSEERMADLDDWRQSEAAGPTKTTADETVAANIERQIDEVQRKIDSFTKADMERNWSTVEKDLHVLQGLKVKGLICWLTKSSNLPEWMHLDLKEHVLNQCYRYSELDEKRKQMQNTWWNLRGKDDSMDLSLDVLYSQIRTCVAKVKYASMENVRHRRELDIYSAWVDRFGPRLREQSRCQLQDLIQQGECKVSEVDQALQIYVEVMQSGQEYARNAASLLDKMRDEKRNILWKIPHVIGSASKEVRYQGVEILSYEEEISPLDENL